MIAKSDILAMLSDMQACEIDLVLMKKDPRSLEEIYKDNRARNKNGDVLYGRDVCDWNYWGMDKPYTYDIEWVNEGPYGDPDKSWTEYTYDELIDMIVKEHRMWLDHRDIWEVPERWHEVTGRNVVK
jgi:hypothetical protein